MDLKIEYVPIDEIKPYENNAKKHTPEQVEQIKQSIIDFGMIDPIAVWQDGIIIEGHGRLMALQELGIREVPIIRLDHLTDEQRRAYGLIHNKLTMSTGFDLDLLEEELQNINQYDMGEFGFAIVIDDIDTTVEQPEEEIAQELGEANNFVVLEFKTEEEWERAKRIFGLKRSHTGDKNPKIRRHGIGRVIDGLKWLDLLEGIEDEY